MKKERDRYFSFYKESNFLRYKQYYLERDILRIAYALFEAEKLLKKHGSISKISLLLSRQTLSRLNTNELKDILRDLFLLILLEDVPISIHEVDDVKGRVMKRATFPKKEAIILFSGGVDSFSGIRISEQVFEDLLGLFVAHSDQPWTIRIVENIKPHIATEIRTIRAPSMGSAGYSQLRGFLYILSAGVYANLCGSDKIIVTECGPTMYQPLFSPYDSITYTTHPYVLKAANDVLDLLLDFKLRIVIPFEDLTKAEVISNSGIRDFSMTHSCISQRFGDHDGTCFGCVLKKLACLINEVKDVKYRKNILEDNVNQDNLLNLLSFSDDIISVYERMPAFQKDKIVEFGKYDLFTRYALDNLAGLIFGVPDQHELYSKFVAEKRNLLEDRIAAVRAKKKKADFNKYVNS